MSPRREIIKMIEKNAHRHGAHQVFGDFVQMGAIAISNAVDLRQREPRESRYLELVKRYDRDEVERFSHMLALLVLELEAEPADVLGTIYMEMELSNSRAGQFFTPYPLCRAMARMQIDGRMRAIIAERGHITVNDPAVGGGALILAMAHEMQLAGINYQLHMHATDATRWITRKCPTGDSEKSWLSVETACEQYQFTRKEIAGFIAGGRLNSRIPDSGPGRGMIYVSRHQCGQLREKIGFTEEQAARRVGVTVNELRTLLEGVDWRQAGLIPLVTVQAVVKRLKSQQGYTLEEAATQLDTTVEWILAKRDDGTIKVSRTNWDRNRIYITMPMFERLRAALLDPQPARERLSADWLMLSDAAEEAGVTTATLIKWANAGEVERKHLAGRWVYRRDSVRARARRYWPTARFHRATPPAWLQGASA